MPREYLKKAPLHARSDASETQAIVRSILDDIEAGGDEKALEYAKKFDQYDGPVPLSPEDIEAATALVPDKLKADIDFAHANVKNFAQAQKATVADFEVEIVPGLVAGQKAIPVSAAIGVLIRFGLELYLKSAIYKGADADTETKRTP